MFATAPRGMEPLLAEELRTLHVLKVEQGRGGVAFQGDLKTAYRVCLWSRIANRILLQLHRFPAPDPQALYEGVRSITWDDHLAVDGTLAVDFHSGQSQWKHSHFGALKTKDAIVDQLRERHGRRPNVDLERPDVRVNVYIAGDMAQLSLDLSGQSLHRRGYRNQSVEAPLKENLAAAILLRAGWPQRAAAGQPLVDLMCGSGTLAIEAALIAADSAPGLLRPYFGFTAWRGGDEALWTELREEARQRRRRGLAQLPPIVGCDADSRAVKAARTNAQVAGLADRLRFEVADIEHRLPEHLNSGGPGLVVANPPYGERLGRDTQLHGLYAALGRRFKDEFGGWQAALYTGNPKLAASLRLRPRRSYSLYNGPIRCRLLLYDMVVRQEDPSTQAKETVAAQQPPPLTEENSRPEGTGQASAGATMLANRLRKNLRHWGRWARRQQISCYRLYDGDLPEYALAIDLYRGERLWVHVQEYAAPPNIAAERVRQRRREALEILPDVLDIAPEQLFFKVRQRQKGKDQYGHMAQQQRYFEVGEGACRFWVNFTDHLDTGLFLDHRLTRQRLQQLASGRRFLNLFAYTGTATVCAAAGGAATTTTIDMASTYLDWARRNMALNGFEHKRHQFVQADCLAWLEGQGKSGEAYDLIFLDPPTFSNSKRMENTFDVQRDHPELIAKTAALLAPGGILVFSTNFRRFKMDPAALQGLQAENISHLTLPPDFGRNPRIHQSWQLSR